MRNYSIHSNNTQYMYYIKKKILYYIYSIYIIHCIIQVQSNHNRNTIVFFLSLLIF